MSWEVLDGARPDDRSRWLQLWQEWPDREISAHPSYVELFASQGQRVLCALWRTATYTIIFPFILRPLGQEPWARGFSGWDLVSPYGYGGPFVWGTDYADAEEFWQAYERWAAEVGLVSAFSRLSLFTEDIVPITRGNLRTSQHNIVRDLRFDDEMLLRDYEHKVRKNIKRAIASGVSVIFDEYGSQFLQDFISIYQSTMQRREAADHYYFDAAFFERIMRELRGQFVFAHAVVDARVISTELVLLSATRAYSFLGGTVADAFPMRPNDLLKHEVSRWARDRGKSAYVLGGGYSAKDGIYRYKKSFAPQGEVRFQVWCHRSNDEQYSRLLEARHIYELQRGADWQPKEGYFPEYRG